MAAGFAWSLSVALLASLVYAAGYLHGRRRRTRRRPGFIPLSRRVSDYGNHTTGRIPAHMATSTGSKTLTEGMPGQPVLRARARTTLLGSSGNASASPPGGRMTGASPLPTEWGML